MAIDGESLVSNYLKELGLIPVKIREDDHQTPDFMVNNTNGELIFYVEEKTIDPDVFLDTAKSFEVVSINDSSQNSLNNKFRKAVKQFDSVNPEHVKPNVLAIVNLNNMMSIHDLFSTLTGYSVTQDKHLIKLSSSVGRIKEDIEKIDLCLWFYQGELQDALWISGNEPHEKVLANIITY